MMELRIGQIMWIEDGIKIRVINIGNKIKYE